jgi:hypothetical protein
MSLLSFWVGSSTSLLEISDSESIINQSLHESFMLFLEKSCRTENTVCVFEAIKETLFGFTLAHVSAISSKLMSHRL